MILEPRRSQENVFFCQCSTSLSGYKLMRLLPNSLFGRIAENDFAGEIVNPNGCDRFKVGDQVFGAISSRVSFRTRHGTLAQYTFGPAETIVHRPETIPVNEASGIALVAITAYQALFDVGKLQSGQKVFINGGSTSVGIYAIQFAKAIGCEVHASASGKNEDFLKSLGVDKVLEILQLGFLADPDAFPTAVR